MPPLRCVGHLQVVREVIVTQWPKPTKQQKNVLHTTACVKTAYPLTHAWPLTGDKSATAFFFLLKK